MISVSKGRSFGEEKRGGGVPIQKGQVWADATIWAHAPTSL